MAGRTQAAGFPTSFLSLLISADTYVLRTFGLGDLVAVWLEQHQLDNVTLRTLHEALLYAKCTHLIVIQLGGHAINLRRYVYCYETF